MKSSRVVLLFPLIIVFAFGSTSRSQYYTTKLTDDAHNGERPRINDDGYVVWQGWEGSGFEIFLYDGTSTAQLTNNGGWYPAINDDGDVVWWGWDGSDTEIFLYDGTSTTQLTNNAYDDFYPQINDNGYVVW